MPSLHSPAWFRQFRTRLLAWYQDHRRHLPWRASCDPYAIWVSEIMLQQTQVATVIDYYIRFLQRFPNLESLASADEQEVLRFWSGLGYYRRARQMQAAAQIIVAQHAGEFPRDLEQLRALPGVGRYTAGAIASFAFNTPAPILEANTQRLFSRLLGMREDPKLSASQTQLWAFAEAILPGSGQEIGSINQAAMELGSLICLPKQPLCDHCPVASLCAAFAAGAQAEIPVPSKRPEFTSLSHALVVVLRRGQVLLRQNPPGQWWQGLWDFPRADITDVKMLSGTNQAAADSDAMRQQVAAALEQQLGLSCQPTRYLTTLRHGVTRHRIALLCYTANPSQISLSENQSWKWTKLRNMTSMPLTSTANKLQKWLLAEPV